MQPDVPHASCSGRALLHVPQHSWPMNSKGQCMQMQFEGFKYAVVASVKQWEMYAAFRLAGIQPANQRLRSRNRAYACPVSSPPLAVLLRIF